MNLIVSGSRGIKNCKQITYWLLNAYYTHGDTIINGACENSPDVYSTQYAIEYGLPFIEYPALWSNFDVEPCIVRYNKFNQPYNLLAGYNRNEYMVNLCEPSDWLLAIWDEKSSGTKHIINYAEGKMNSIIYYVVQNKLVLNSCFYKGNDEISDLRELGYHQIVTINNYLEA